ncbi:MAG: fumarate hydratase [Bacillota bacterium]|nr:fumarate hydratase [Bacillota bacterium]REJ35612.1 MAG: fumarate hydratase [Bacillota bacterium]
MAEAAGPGRETLPRRVHVDAIRQAVAELLMEANYCIGDDVLDALRQAAEEEQSPLGRDILTQLVANYELARQERVPACQDTGLTIVFLEIGQDVHLVGGDLREAVNAGIREGTKAGFLRNSVVGDPLLRRNTGDNAPGVLHVDIIPGDRVHVTVACKGFGSENKSRLAMLTPADGVEGVKRFVVETVDRAGAQACPPLIVGVGIGGSFELAARLAKQAVIRPINQRHPRPDIRALEEELLEEVNRLGIGPQGLGGIKTALAVNIEVYPTHIAGLPVAVNIGCHSNRHRDVWL